LMKKWELMYPNYLTVFVAHSM